MRFRVIFIVLLATAANGPAGAGAREDPGLPRYPDLVARASRDLYLSREVLADGLPHHLLRFTTTVANVGEGPLELAGDSRPGDGNERTSAVYQHVYDAERDGAITTRIAIGANLVFHPAHYHFHLDEFASFRLFRRLSDGTIDPSPLAGAKTSSCLLDSTRIDPEVTEEATYRDCERDRQGISVGWSDVYAASLPNQWIDLGGSPLPDGDYAIEFTVDPANRILEQGRDANNTVLTEFTVGEGRIEGALEPPRCAADPAVGVVGATLRLDCVGFEANQTGQIFWDQRDPWQHDGPIPDAMFVADERGRGGAEIVVPEAVFGGHNLVVAGFGRLAPVAIVGVQPSLAAAASLAQAAIRLELHGFGAEETVQLTWEPTGATPVTLGEVTTLVEGNAVIAVADRGAMPDRGHVRAVGARSGAVALAALAGAQLPRQATPSPPDAVATPAAT